ncbi:glycine--tRNA ligase [bacterium]|nr:glycine--tRNA ligase [bacterium]
MTKSMDKIVSLCKRRGFVFQNSEIYGGQNGFWDYGPLGTELKRNVRENWYSEMVTNHDELTAPDGAPRSFNMCGIETSLIMNPQVWRCSGHYDLFADMMIDCRECKSRFRADHISVAAAIKDGKPVRCQSYIDGNDETALSKTKRGKLEKSGDSVRIDFDLETYAAELAAHDLSDNEDLQPACPKCKGSLTEPRQFNLMLETNIGAIQSEKNRAFLRPETAQGMFVNFKNVTDSCRVKVPFGIAQVGKSFRNEITPRNFTFRSREFEQMEMEFFCHPEESFEWYQYWRDRRYAWYVNLGISKDNLILRDHAKEELAHYSVGTADVEYAFPFLPEGEYGELEGIAHRGDFDLRSHMEGKLCKDENGELIVEKNEHGQPKYRGSGKDLTWFDDQAKTRFTPHVIEPAAGADRATLAFICEAWCEDSQPDSKGNMQTREVMKFHPKLAPIKVGVFPLTKKDGQPEKAAEVYRELKAAGIATTYEQQGAIGKRYRRQDEIGTPWCITIDTETADNDTVTLRDRDTLEQVRLPANEVVNEIAKRLRTS